ncbi:MAG TPA: hypothetical protein PLA61_06455 [Ferruginibacter sp.]|nr:hypothetical protein [Ferruginibacter sp.]
MRYLLALLLLPVFFTACSGSKKEPSPGPGSEPEKKSSFFPVTSYIKGQIFDIRRRGINPLYHVTSNNRTDSTWLKLEDIEKAVHAFLEPVIDSTNLTSLFDEKDFLDQTIAAYTFTYEPKASLPDNMTLRRWDVYIDAESNKVRRIYMVKKINENQTLQLTWQSNKYCKVVTIGTDSSGNSRVEKEEQITWDFNQ